MTEYKRDVAEYEFWSGGTIQGAMELFLDRMEEKYVAKLDGQYVIHAAFEQDDRGDWSLHVYCSKNDE